MPAIIIRMLYQNGTDTNQNDRLRRLGKHGKQKDSEFYELAGIHPVWEIHNDAFDQ